MSAQDLATFDGMLKRLRDEGGGRWRMQIIVTANEEYAKEVRFINREHERTGAHTQGFR